jgi:aspartate kinase
MMPRSKSSTTKAERGAIVVQKFGGSSLATPELRELAAGKVRSVAADGQMPVVVTSALGRLPAPYATDSLLTLMPGASHGPNRDLLLACGEIIGASVFAELLTAIGLPARALTGGQAGIITDSKHGEARIVRVDPSAIRALIDDGIIPVIAGFQGMTEDGTVTTIGRGGSDLTAVAIAGALGGATLEIFTDVDGVMSADPRRVSDAHTVDRLTLEEVSELAGLGANVMHDKAAQLARDARIPFSVRNLRGGVGSVIGDDASIEHGPPVTGLATMVGYSFFHMLPEAAAMQGGWEQDIFRVMYEAGINLDCINVNGAGVFFIVQDNEHERARELLDALPVAARSRRDCAKVSIVGAGMRGTPGVMFRVVEALGRAGVPIIHSTDSNITISVLVPGTLAGAAESALHEYFKL